MQAQQQTVPLAVLAAAPALLLGALPALADEGEQPQEAINLITGFFSNFANLTPAGVLLLSSPVLLYAVFNVYRAQVNPKAKWSDFVFIGAAVLIAANLISIVAFRIRLF